MEVQAFLEVKAMAILVTLFAKRLWVQITLQVLGQNVWEDTAVLSSATLRGVPYSARNKVRHCLLS